MKLKFARRIMAAVLAGLAMLVVAGTVAASSSSYAWTMNNRFVNGRHNGQLHTLDGGELTISGKIWITDKRTAASSSPDAVTIEVMKDTFLDNVVCTVQVVPNTTLNSKKEYSKSCGRIESGKYWIRISKPKANSKDGDGWHSQGSGTLTTT